MQVVHGFLDRLEALDNIRHTHTPHTPAAGAGTPGGTYVGEWLIIGLEALVSITNYRKDGSEFENYVFILPIFNDNGDLLYMLGSQCDITTSLRTLTPIEHAKLLDEGIELASPRLELSERLHIPAHRPLAHAMQTVLTGEMFE